MSKAAMVILNGAESSLRRARLKVEAQLERAARIALTPIPQLLRSLSKIPYSNLDRLNLNVATQGEIEMNL